MGLPSTSHPELLAHPGIDGLPVVMGARHQAGFLAIFGRQRRIGGRHLRMTVLMPLDFHHAALHAPELVEGRQGLTLSSQPHGLFEFRLGLHPAK